MKKIFFCFLLLTNMLFAQNLEDKYTTAVDLYVDGKFEEALIMFKKFENTEKHNLNKILYFEGQTLFELNRKKESLKIFDKNIKLFPKSLISYLGKAEFYLYSENYNKAIEYFSKAIQIDDKHATALYERGECYFNTDQYSLAIKDYTSAINLDNNNAQYYLSRSICYTLMQDNDKACIDYNEAIELKPSISETYQLDDCK